MTRLRSPSWLAVLVLVSGLGFGCSKSGTFVTVSFDVKTGTTAPKGIRSIDLALSLGGKSDMTSYAAPGGADIALPTTATLEVGAGSGALAVTATLRDKNGAALGTGTALGTVTTGSTTHVSVQFGGSPTPDGGGGNGGSSGSDGGAGGEAGEANDGGFAGGGTDAGPTAAMLVTDKTTYDFGTQVTTAMGAAVGSTVVTVTNMGGQKSGTLTVGVADSMTFPASADTCSGMMLDPGASCTVTVKFMPATAGMKSSKLQVGATPGGMAAVTLSGMGVDPGALSVSPDHGAFDPLAAGQTSPEATFTVKNTGGAATTALTAMLTGTTAGEFKLSTDNCTGKTLAGGAMCTVGVEFAPTSAGTPGAESAVLSVGAMTGGTTTANLMGTLLGPAAISIVPTDQDFLMIVQGQTSPEYIFTVTNKGGVTTGALTAGASPPGEFAITSDTCSGMTLAPNGNCKIGIKMTPSGTGMRSASLGVRGTPGGNAVATLRGTGLAPGQIALAAQGAFNVVDVGSPVTVPFTVTNTGGAPTTAITLGLTGATEFTITSDTCTNMTLAAGAMCSFNVVFTPTTFGARSGMLSAMAATGGTSTATLSATGRDYVTLTVMENGPGGGAVSASGLTCVGSVCTGKYARTDAAAFQVVNVAATPDSLSTFAGWGVACTGTGACQITMSDNQMATASFAVKTVLITATINGVSGQTGTVATDDGAFTCPSTSGCGPSKHDAKAMITFKATPGGGMTFIAWSNGPCKGVNPTCTIPLTSDVNITATFGPPNYMFVTSTTVIPGRLNGIAGADAACAQSAMTAGLPGTYKAWINDKGVDANTRVGAGGWVRTDGRPFTRNLAALTAANGVVYYPPRVDENGNDLGPKRIQVLTGGNGNGTNFGYQCNGTGTASYTSQTGSAYIGMAAAGSGYWSYNELDSSGCMNQQHLYCFRTDLAPAGAPVGITVPPVTSARRIFVTDFAFTPTALGLAAADKQCQADATYYALPNAANFVAFLATSTKSAISRVNLAGPPWKRTDEVLIVSTAADLGAGNLISPIDLAGDGATYKNPQMWTGMMDPNQPGTNTCKDWTSNSVNDKGTMGYPNAAVTPDWYNSFQLTCDNMYAWVMCIEP
jgi:hypothetical protein